MEPLQAIYGLWDLWVVSWLLAALWSARTLARPIAWSQLWRDGIALAGAIVLFRFSAPEGAFPADNLRGVLLAPLWRAPAPIGWGLVVLTAASLAFCWWARLHLGRLWSGVTAVKSGHRIVDTGPYGLVRHPIYSGLLGGLVSMALMKGTLAGLAGLALAMVGLSLRAKLEEQFLRVELGTEAYDAYSRRVAMLIPRPRRTRTD